MTQRRKSQSIGPLITIVFSAMILWALTAIVWPVPAVYADDPEILTITVTSNRETYFYDPGLEPSGGTVYFNSVGGQGAGQVLTVTVTCSGTVNTFEGAPAFGDNPPPDTSAPWQVAYTVTAGVGTQSGIVFTITNTITETDTAVITFTEDNTGPTVITPNIYLFAGSDYLYVVDDLTIFYGDDMGTPQNFLVRGYADDTGAGPYQAAYPLAFNDQPPTDDITAPPHSWAGEYSVYQTDCCTGIINVTVTDRVGNATTQTFTYTKDTISPTISSPSISETSPYLYTDNLTLYYSDLMEGSAQDFEVQGTASDDIDGAGFRHVTFNQAFGDTPGPDSNPSWNGRYNVVRSDSGDGNIVVTAYDNVGNWSTGVFTYIEDFTNPTVTLTYVTPGGYDEDNPDDWLDADGSNWYKADNFINGDWDFTSDTADEGAGLAFCTALWDHSDDTDDTTGCTLDGDGVFTGVVSYTDGTVTVTVTITDHVGNPASDAVVFNIDNTGPEITSADISEDSDYLYTDTLTIYYGAGMGLSAQRFAVHGQSNDGEGVGLGDVDFSPALGEDPDNQGTLSDWCGEYDVTSHNTDSGTITVTISDLLDNPAYQTFDYIRDTEPPTVVVACPAVWSEPSWSVSLSGGDPPPDPSGFKHFDVQYKVESGDWQGWFITDTSEIEATFGPTSPVPVEDGKTYYFKVEAEDNVSNVQYGECKTTYLPGIKKVFLPIVMKGYCGPDNYEPNDSCDQAYGPLASGPTYQSWISGCDQATYKKSDYFYIDISTTNAINISLTNIPAGTNYDLYLYTKYPCGPDNRVGKPEPGTTPETISYSPPDTGRYYIRVYGHSGSSASPYSLRVTYD